MAVRFPSRPRKMSRRKTWSLSRSEEHTSELQSRSDLVCRLLLEKKKKQEQRASRDNAHRLQTHCGSHITGSLTPEHRHPAWVITVGAMTLRGIAGDVA